MPQKFSSPIYRVIVLWFLAVTTLIYSCKKDLTINSNPSADPKIEKAKLWYQNSFPKKPLGTNTIKTTSTDGTEIDPSQILAPDWDKATNYTRFNSDVLDLPIDGAGKLQAVATNSAGPNKYSSSNYIVLNQDNNYKAYIMTVIADQDYLNGDTAKVALNKYNKRDANFSGYALYSTPKGKFVDGYRYKNGALVGRVLPDTYANNNRSDNVKTQSVAVNSAAVVTICTYFYTITTYGDNEPIYHYYGQTCKDYPVDDYGDDGGSPGGGGSGGSGGGGTTTNPPVKHTPCIIMSAPDKLQINDLKVQNAPLPPPFPGDGGFPPPVDDDGLCPTVPEPVVTPDEDGIFGINNSNAVVPDANFNALLTYAQGLGLIIYEPYEADAFDNDGNSYHGKITLITDSNGNIVSTYFTPDSSAGPFLTGMNYNLGYKGPDGTNTTTNTTLGNLLTGGQPPFGGGNIIYTPHGSGGGTGGTPPVFTITIKTDSLSKNFPCVTKLVINKLTLDPNYSNWLAPFSSNRKPDIIWQNSSLQWNVPSNAITAGFTARLGETTTSASANDADRSAIISLNTTLLQKGSKLLIASVAIHETLHAYINYRLKTVVVGFSPPPQYSNTKSWIYALDSYSFTFGLPSNYRDHNQMLSEFFEKGISILRTYDNSAHTDKQYAMLMLYGLDTGDLLPLQGSLDQLYNSTMSKYNISAADLRTYWVSQLNANANEKLPTTGCN